MRPNWFIALPIDGRFLSELPPLPKNFRLFDVGDTHMTVAFLGGCGQAAAVAAVAALERELDGAPQAAIDVALGPVVPMGRSKRNYTALAASLSFGNDEAAQLIEALRRPLLSAAARRPDTRPIHPHITLGRPARRASASDRDAGLAWAAAIDLSDVRERLRRIALYTWSDQRPRRQFSIAWERALE